MTPEIRWGTKNSVRKRLFPVWMEYMSYVLRNDKQRSWPVPPGIEFAGSPSFSRRSYGRSVISSAHFAPGRRLKQISPIDAVSAPFSEGVGAYSPWFGPAAFGAFSHYGLIRVLSPNGETIGFAAYTQDAKGQPGTTKYPLSRRRPRRDRTQQYDPFCALGPLYVAAPPASIL